MRHVKNTIGWAQDYLYVAYWLTRGFVRREKSDAYRAAHLDSVRKAPILIIPGVYESWQFMLPIIKQLHAQGHSVHVLEKLGYNTGAIDKMALVVSDYLEEHQLTNVIVVAHSKGGLIAKYVLTTGDANKRVKHIITINTPYSGSKYAYLFLLPSVRTFTPNNRIIKFLSQNRELNGRISSLYSEFDPHIPEGSFLPGAQNIALSTIGHFRPVGAPQTMGIITRIISKKEKEDS